MNTKLLAVCLFLATGACASGPVHGSGWVRLGERTVTDRIDHDRIDIGARAGEFDRIKLTVDRTAVDFHRVLVIFGNGTRQEIPIRTTIRAGGETRSIDLDGGDRVIRAVEFWYDARTMGGRRAVVRLFGRR
ncbi:MAG: DUF2541 family protein [Gemmatimonadota bacterium]|nr:DUF2541 family protein [Gemmatimonadota bacterium]MDH3426818.1 DUF2541 family protein [Gemmatimonadota bacterium]